jgi:hypothetical protein
VTDAADAVPRHHRTYRALAFRCDPGIARVERDAQFEHPAGMLGKTPVAQVHAEEVDVRRRKRVQIVQPPALAAADAA